MKAKTNTNGAMLERQGTVFIKERIIRIGIIFLFVAFIISILVVNIKYFKPSSPDPDTNLGRIVWDSLFSIPSAAFFFVDFIVSIILLRRKNLRKGRIICMAVVLFIVATFNNIAIGYPLQQEWIALTNFTAVFFFAVVMLLQKAENNITGYPRNNSFSNSEITKTMGNTDNKKIIAVQLYKVETSQVFTEDHSERIRFEVSHIGNDFVRAGYDVNSISKISYELDREIVDAFPIILNLYHQFRANGDDTTKNAILTIINEKISLLEATLHSIETLQRPITKADCCLARALTIFLSFKHILSPPPGAKESQDDCIGEISLHDGDLKLSSETESQLFSLYRTGILGAALLDKDLRHIFHYRKDGTKAGRKYSVSQLICDTGKDIDKFSSQTMYICLFTIKESDTSFIPGFVFKSISEREEEITNVLNKMRKGGEASA